MKEHEDLLSEELAAYATPQLGAGVGVPLDGGEVIQAVLLQPLAHCVQVVVRHHDLRHPAGCRWADSAPLTEGGSGGKGGGCFTSAQEEPLTDPQLRCDTKSSQDTKHQHNQLSEIPLVVHVKDSS